MDSIASEGQDGFHFAHKGQSVDDLISQYMVENNVPGMVLAIVQAPYITRVVGYGVADIKSKRRVAGRTVFHVGQLTNAFTAVAIMQLKESSALLLDDLISKYIPDITETWQTITIRELLIHSSGIADYTKSSSFDYATNYQPDDIIKLVKNAPLLFKPGTQMQISASNPYLLGLIIEKVSGMSYQEYVTKNQIERVGLKNTFFITNINSLPNEINNATNPFKHSQFLQNPAFINPVELATGYDQVGDNLEAVSPMRWTASFSNSGIVASAEDISLWDISLAGEILVKDPENRRFLYNTQTLNEQTIHGNSGWLFPGHKGLMAIKGTIPGYSAFLSRFTDPAELLCVTLLANKGNLPDLDILGRKIAATFNIKLGTPQGAFWSETVQSPYSVKQTIERVKNIIEKNGGTVFAHFDHAAEAKKTNQSLQDTEVLIIGNPAKGTVLMQKNPAFALDLPLRIMATKDSSEQVWLSFTDPVALAKEYRLDAQQIPVLKQIARAIKIVCENAVSAQTLF